MDDVWMDCGEHSYCKCSRCADNEVNGGSCSHCFACVCGSKAEDCDMECFVAIV